MLTAFFVIFYLAHCVLIGFLGRNRIFGFWGYFFFSLLVTPVVGFLAIIGGAPRLERR